MAGAGTPTVVSILIVELTGRHHLLRFPADMPAGEMRSLVVEQLRPRCAADITCSLARLGTYEVDDTSPAGVRILCNDSSSLGSLRDAESAADYAGAAVAVAFEKLPRVSTTAVDGATMSCMISAGGTRVRGSAGDELIVYPPGFLFNLVVYSSVPRATTHAVAGDLSHVAFFARPSVIQRFCGGGRVMYVTEPVVLNCGLAVWAPFYANFVIACDRHGQFKDVGPVLDGSCKFRADGVRLGDDCAYFAPSNVDFFIRVTPAQIVELLHPQWPRGVHLDFIAGGVVGADGCGYFLTSDGEYVARVLPAGASIAFIPIPGTTPSTVRRSRFVATGCMNESGIIYFPPFDDTRCVRIDSNIQTVQFMHTDIGELNRTDIHGKYSVAGALLSDGCVYFPPDHCSRVLRISEEGRASLLDPELPTVGDTKYRACGTRVRDTVVYPPFDAIHMLLLSPSSAPRLVPLPDDVVECSMKCSAAGVALEDDVLVFPPYNLKSFLELRF